MDHERRRTHAQGMTAQAVLPEGPLTITMLPDTTILSASASVAARFGSETPEDLVGKRLADFPLVRKSHCVQLLKQLHRITPEKPSFSARVFVNESDERVHVAEIEAAGTFAPGGRLLMLRLACEPDDITTCVDERPRPIYRWGWKHRRLLEVSGAVYMNALGLALAIWLASFAREAVDEAMNPQVPLSLSLKVEAMLNRIGPDIEIGRLTQDPPHHH
jgi:hypothetical protein